jgi:hypothetical protein
VAWMLSIDSWLVVEQNQVSKQRARSLEVNLR